MLTAVAGKPDRRTSVETDVFAAGDPSVSSHCTSPLASASATDDGRHAAMANEATPTAISVRFTPSG